MPQSKDQATAVDPEDLPLPIILWRARLAVSACYRAKLREFGLTEQQWRVLRRLSRVAYEDISDMATQTDIMAPSLSRILRDLADRKFLVRAGRKSMDKRRVFASLTPAGRRLVREVQADVAPITNEIEGHIGSEKLADLKKTLGGLIAWLEHREEWRIT